MAITRAVPPFRVRMVLLGLLMILLLLPLLLLLLPLLLLLDRRPPWAGRAR